MRVTTIDQPVVRMWNTSSLSTNSTQLLNYPLSFRITAASSRMDHERVREAAKRRATLEIREMQKRARAQAEHEYVTGPALDVAANPPVTPVDRKRTMRNKSAFISRQTQRHYQRFLSEYITEAENQRDAALKQKQKTQAEIAALRDLQLQLQRTLTSAASTIAPETTPTTGRPRVEAGSSSRSDALRDAVTSDQLDTRLRSQSTPAGGFNPPQPPTTYGIVIQRNPQTSTTSALSFGAPPPSYVRPRTATNITTGLSAPSSYEATTGSRSFRTSSGYGANEATTTSSGAAAAVFDGLFDSSGSGGYRGSSSSSAAVYKAAAALTGWGPNTPATSLGTTVGSPLTSAPLPITSNGASTGVPYMAAAPPSLPTNESSVQEILDDALATGDWAAQLPRHQQTSTSTSTPPTTRQDSFP